MESEIFSAMALQMAGIIYASKPALVKSEPLESGWDSSSLAMKGG